ncbi:MAG TPA: Ig-like domain-containing protein [Kofleriaceae bacterium]|nr:Ig-like domain-containing protein [Kofleriaceae bacterium]
MGRIAGALLCLGVLAVFAFGSFNVSCYSPPTPSCGFQCNKANYFQCPAAYTCSRTDGVCKLNSAPASTQCPSDAPPDVPGLDADATNPTVTATDPMDGATNVPRTGAIRVAFSRDVIPPDSLNFIVDDGAVLQTGTYTYDPGTFTATYVPLGALEGGHVITVRLTSNIVGSNAARSPLTPYTFSYTTFDDEPPMLASSTPLDSATMVPVGSTIVVVFSEPVAGVDTTSLTVAQGATGLPGTVSANPDQKTYTFTPTAALPAASVITVTLSTGIHDLSTSANPLAQTTFSFTTQ